MRPTGTFPPLTPYSTVRHAVSCKPFASSRVYGVKEGVMDGKYNMLLDNMSFRLALNVVVFALWLGVAVALVAAA